MESAKMCVPAASSLSSDASSEGENDGEGVGSDVAKPKADAWRNSITSILQQPGSTDSEQVLHIANAGIIIFSLILATAETMRVLRGLRPVFLVADMIITVLFAAEVGVRIFFTLRSKRDLTMDMLNLVDLVAIGPGLYELVQMFWRAHLATTDSELDAHMFLNSLRVLRMVRLVQIARFIDFNVPWPFVDETKLLFRVVGQIANGLAAFNVLLLVCTLIFASFMYILESPDCDTEDVADALMPRKCITWAYCESIPAACWWAILTLTPVGYGDVLPTTLGGHVLAAVASIVGVLVLCFGSGFVSYFVKRSWPLEKARFDAQRHSISSPALQANLDEIERLRAQFQRVTEDIMAELTLLVNEADHSLKAPSSAWMASLREDSENILNEVHCVIYGLLFHPKLKATT